MTKRAFTSRFLASIVALSLLLLTPFFLVADPVPGKDDRLLAQMVCEMLQDGHVTRPKISDEISKRLFKHFLKDLDSGKSYFLKSDIDEFRKHETELDDMLLQRRHQLCLQSLCAVPGTHPQRLT